MNNKATCNNLIAAKVKVILIDMWIGLSGYELLKLYPKPYDLPPTTYHLQPTTYHLQPTT
ncbi:MAG TPA: hypothetical protein VK021_01215 [Flavobacteriaceae bacterium]|nr:hypothetical protein [Flavobacteriaceae bacterium]